MSLQQSIERATSKKDAIASGDLRTDTLIPVSIVPLGWQQLMLVERAARVWQYVFENPLRSPFAVLDRWHMQSAPPLEFTLRLPHRAIVLAELRNTRFPQAFSNPKSAGHTCRDLPLKQPSPPLQIPPPD